MQRIFVLVFVGAWPSDVRNVGPDLRIGFAYITTVRVGNQF